MVRTRKDTSNVWSRRTDEKRSPPMKIRDYYAQDATALAKLYQQSVMVLGLRDYSSRQVEVWASLGPDPERIHQLIADGRTRLVAVDDLDRPVAFADLERDGHIDFIFCSPDMAGKGAASALYDALEKSAREFGLNRLRCEASEAGRRFFLKKGFTVLTRRQIEVSGVAIHNYAMEKIVAHGPAG